MEEHQRRGAGDREQAEPDRHPDRQHRRRDQDRGEEQKRKRILQAAGQEQQRGQFDDVERKQRRRIERFQPLHRVEGNLQREIEHRRNADNGNAGDDGKLEFQPLPHDEDRGELAERSQPAQPQDRIETDIAVSKAEIGGCNVGHCGSLAVWKRDHKFARFSGPHPSRRGQGAAPQDEGKAAIAAWKSFDPHGEEPQSGVSNHAGPDAPKSASLALTPLMAQ